MYTIKCTLYNYAYNVQQCNYIQYNYGPRIKALQRSVAGQMHDKLNLHSPDSTTTN